MQRHFLKTQTPWRILWELPPILKSLKLACRCKEGTTSSSIRLDRPTTAQYSIKTKCNPVIPCITHRCPQVKSKTLEVCTNRKWLSVHKIWLWHLHLMLSIISKRREYSHWLWSSKFLSKQRDVAKKQLHHQSVHYPRARRQRPMKNSLQRTSLVNSSRWWTVHNRIRKRSNQNWIKGLKMVAIEPQRT